MQENSQHIPAKLKKRQRLGYSLLSFFLAVTVVSIIKCFISTNESMDWPAAIATLGAALAILGFIGWLSALPLILSTKSFTEANPWRLLAIGTAIGLVPSVIFQCLRVVLADY